MLKTFLLVTASSVATAFATSVYVGRTAYSSGFRADIPFGTAVKTTVDPANVWSWHHEFTQVGGSQIPLPPVDVLVDIDGDNAMDTAQAWRRVLITDIAFVSVTRTMGIVWILDDTGKRFAVGTGRIDASGPVHHVALGSPIALPVGSGLRVQVQALQGQADLEVHLIGRVVNL